MSSSDEDLIICSALFIVMNSEARRKKRKRRWWIKTLLKKKCGGLSLLANLNMEDESGFRNFTRMTASDFELLMTIIGSKVSRQDTNYKNL
jgi:hypothetical protein